MIKTLPTLVLSLAAFTSGASQQPAPVHRWTPVVAKPDVRIELDTGTATRTDHQRRVWLRWTFPTPVPDLADVQLERREVDCRRGQTRILSTEDVGGQQPPRILSTEDVRGQQPPRVTTDSPAASARYHGFHGSLDPPRSGQSRGAGAHRGLSVGGGRRLTSA